MQQVVTIKGGKDGLRLHIADDAEWQQVMRALQEQFVQGQQFFSGARLHLDVGERTLTDAQLAEVLGLMSSHGIVPQHLIAADRDSRDRARAAGLTVRVAPETRPAAGTPTVAPAPEATLLVRTVRSGQVIRHAGHVTLIGDVNAGAEIIAGGSVVVWGRLRGLVHAGAMGDRTAVIAALELRPTQLRIANLIARTPEDATAGQTVPEVASVEDDHILVETWAVYRK